MQKYRLTYPQKNILLVEKFNKGLPINSIVGTVEIYKDFDEKICNEAINSVIKNNEAMRLNFIDEDGEVLQYVKEFKYKNFEVVKLEMYSDEEKAEYINNCVSFPLLLEKNNLYEFKILDYGKGRGAIFMKIHHIISDAWSCSKIGTSLIDYIEKKSNGEEIEDELKPSYIEFIQKEEEYEKSEKFIKDENFWNEYLKGIKEPTLIKDKRSNVSTKSKRYNKKLDYDINKKINEYCRENKISSYVLFLTALSTYIYRIRDNKDIVLGTPVLNRSNFKEKDMLGMFISTLPIRIQIDEDIKFLDLAKKVATNTLTLFRHQKYPYYKTLEYVHKETDIKDNLYNIILSYQNARTNVIDKEKYGTTWPFVGHLNDQLQMHIMDMDNTGILNINYDYQTDIFSDVEIEYLHTRIMAIIENAINDVNVNVENVAIMSVEEKNKILKEFNNTRTLYPSKKTIIQIFEEQVQKSPNKEAIFFENKSITYKELNEKSDRLAYYLSNNKGIKPNDIIGIMIDKSFELIISIIACLKCGAAYLPIDKEYPIDRINYIIENTDCKLVLVNENNPNIPVDYILVSKVLLSEFSTEKIVLTNAYNENSIVYVMYTSGTTGTPKGVCVSNKNIIRLVINTNYIDFYQSDRIIQTGSTVFDASTLEIWGALLNGIPLYLIKKKDLLNPQYFDKYLQENSITIMWLTSPLFNQMADYNINMFKKLRILLVGGDVLSVKNINRLIEHCPNVKIINGYGPTENTTFSTCYNIRKKFDSSIPIGKPISNSFCYIVDSKKRLLPLYVEGELLVGGDGVAKGYFNDDDKTNRSFIKNPFCQGDMAYKTGDVVYWLETGDIKFIGRRDNQIKIRGFRVDLDEIKYYVLKYPSINDCYVTIKGNDDKKHIAIIYTSLIKIKEEVLIDFLKQNLPNYMIPTYLLQIDELPLNNNEKIDTKRLNEILSNLKKKEVLELKKIKYEGIYKKIYELFSEVLNNKNIGINDNFFEIGGDSLVAIQLVTKAISKDINITYNDFYKNPTIKQLGDFLNKDKENVSISKDIETFDYTDVNSLLKNNIIDNSLKNNEKIGNVLLTGVTGFLGAHILDELMKQEKGKIYCLVRTKNNVNIEDRVKKKLHFFFGSKYDEELGKRIILVKGNMENSNIIDNKEEYEMIKKDITTVINSAANVKHFGRVERFKRINVYAVENLIKFCVKNKKRLIHISTLSVSGNILETGQIQQDNIDPNTIYNENNLYIGQNLDNIYAYTKFLAEKKVLDSIYHDKLDAKIMRMGNLTGRMSDGRFQPNVAENAFANRLKTFINLEVIPKNLLDFYLEFTPIDYAAIAVVTLARTNSHYNTFHLFNHNHVQMLKALEVFEKLGITLKRITKREMTSIIKELSSKEDGYNKVNGIILDINKNQEIEYKPNVIVKSNFTIELLEQMGFKWPHVDEEYIEKYMNYLFEIGFLNKKGEK